MQFVYDVDRAPVTRSEPSYLSSPDSSKRLQSRLEEKQDSGKDCV